MTTPGRAARRLIITADDFGMSREVNEAVEEAHRKGVLTAASLVVTGDAAADAVERARRMPSLGVGLHLALVSADPALPPAEIPALMARDGHGLGSSPERVGALMSLSPKVAAQARAETRAQLDLYRKTGLPLDHVDGTGISTSTRQSCVRWSNAPRNTGSRPCVCRLSPPSPRGDQRGRSSRTGSGSRWRIGRSRP